jgi:hypothetical protein
MSMRWVGHVALMEYMQTAYKILVGSAEPKRPPDRSGYNIRINIIEMKWRGVDWIHLARDRVQWRGFVNTALNLWVPLEGGELLD